MINLLFDQPLDRPRVAVVTSTYARSQDDHQVPWMREMTRRTAPGLPDLEIFAAGFRGLKSHQIDGIPVRRFRYAPARWEALTHDEGAPSKSRSLSYKLLTIPYLLCGMLSIFYWCIVNRTTVLHVHWPFPHGLWALLPKWFLGIKVVSMCHGAELALARKSKPIRWALTFFLKQSDAIRANSSHTAAEIKRLTGLDAEIIPYGATIQETPAPPAATTAEEKVPLLLFCGRLIQRKGIDVLLHALPQVLAKREVRLVITGEGDRKAEWQALSTELGLDDKVEFAGFVSNERLGSLYQECDLYVHPAIHDDQGDTEGLGVVLIEALACRKPVVASAVGGIVDVIIDGETGLLVPEKDPKALSKAILTVLADQDLSGKLGEQGHDHARRFFDWDRCAQLTLQSYHDLSHNEPAATRHTLPA
ncbi:glycosyltransferase family 4 protein [Roseibacillus ishigakijimensis]|uniref:Glycosyltransferase family 4 protein n=1 Tax=Roseibacillus ishigakijimensis TaxID=454146 RepID=A0A934RT21_9BACT|nr:glycosyltransferase family 4 protein [Roseibacillus ishigakijimensis]MBK1835136.1 glycosyltransferase family 4 protein [Roseibacillus ishigakijimensis]